jgi:hypothetical protein
MTCTITHHLSTGKTIRKGTPSPRPGRWDVSVWFLLPSGEKSTHSVTINGVTLTDLVPAVAERLDEMIAEMGNDVREAGWQAHGRGPVKRRKH